MSHKKKDLQLVFTLRWQNGPDDVGETIMGLWNFPATLNFDTFKSYLLKNSGVAGDDVKVAYVTDEGQEWVIETETEYERALNAFRLKARLKEMIYLNVHEKVGGGARRKIPLPPPSPKPSNADAETQSVAQAEVEMLHKVTATVPEMAPEWFVSYMDQFKVTILEEVRAMNKGPEKLTDVIADSSSSGSDASDFVEVVQSAEPEVVIQPAEPDVSKVPETDWQAASVTQFAEPKPTPVAPPTKVQHCRKTKGGKSGMWRVLKHQDVIDSKAHIKFDHKLEKLERLQKRIQDKRDSLEQRAKESAASFEQILQSKCNAISRSVTSDECKRVTPGQFIWQKWLVENNGLVPWPKQTTLKFTWGTEGFATCFHHSALDCPSIASGERCVLKVALVAPMQPGTYTSNWNFYVGSFRFGQSVQCKVLVDHVVTTDPWCHPALDLGYMSATPKVKDSDVHQEAAEEPVVVVDEQQELEKLRIEEKQEEKDRIEKAKRLFKEQVCQRKKNAYEKYVAAMAHHSNAACQSAITQWVNDYSDKPRDIYADMLKHTFGDDIPLLWPPGPLSRGRYGIEEHELLVQTPKNGPVPWFAARGMSCPNDDEEGCCDEECVEHDRPLPSSSSAPAAELPKGTVKMTIKITEEPVIEQAEEARQDDNNNVSSSSNTTTTTTMTSVPTTTTRTGTTSVPFSLVHEDADEAREACEDQDLLVLTSDDSEEDDDDEDDDDDAATEGRSHLSFEFLQAIEDEMLMNYAKSYGKKKEEELEREQMKKVEEEESSSSSSDEEEEEVVVVLPEIPKESLDTFVFIDFNGEAVKVPKSLIAEGVVCLDQLQDKSDELLSAASPDPKEEGDQEEEKKEEKKEEETPTTTANVTPDVVAAAIADDDAAKIETRFRKMEDDLKCMMDEEDERDKQREKQRDKQLPPRGPAEAVANSGGVERSVMGHAQRPTNEHLASKRAVKMAAMATPCGQGAPRTFVFPAGQGGGFEVRDDCARPPRPGGGPVYHMTCSGPPPTPLSSNEEHHHRQEMMNLCRNRFFDNPTHPRPGMCPWNNPYHPLPSVSIPVPADPVMTPHPKFRHYPYSSSSSSRDTPPRLSVALPPAAPNYKFTHVYSSPVGEVPTRRAPPQIQVYYPDLHPSKQHTEGLSASTSSFPRGPVISPYDMARSMQQKGTYSTHMGWGGDGLVSPAAPPPTKAPNSPVFGGGLTRGQATSPSSYVTSPPRSPPNEATAFPPNTTTTTTTTTPQPTAPPQQQQYTGNSGNPAATVIHTFPENLLDGAVNVASSAINTAKTVLSMMAPKQQKETGQWVKGEWIDESQLSVRSRRISQLVEMGFCDVNLNATILARHDDNLEKALNELLYYNTM